MIQCTVEQSRAHFAKLADGGRRGDDSRGPGASRASTRRDEALPSSASVLRVPIALEIVDQSRAEMAIGLLARIDRHVAPEEVERLGADAEGATIGDRADGAGRRQAGDDPVDRRLHCGCGGDFVADQPSFGTVAGKPALILDELPGEPIADEARQAQIRSAGNDAFFARRQRHIGVGRRERRSP